MSEKKWMREFCLVGVGMGMMELKPRANDPKSRARDIVLSGQLTEMEEAIGEFASVASMFKYDYVGLKRKQVVINRDIVGFFPERQFLQLDLRIFCTDIERQNTVEQCLAHLEDMLKKFELSYRVKGDDILIELPVSKEELVAASVDISDHGKTCIVSASMNITRILYAIIEIHQTIDYAVRIPECLQPFMKGIPALGDFWRHPLTLSAGVSEVG